MEADNCNKNKKLNMTYDQRNVTIEERDIKFVADQQNQDTSNQGNISINSISRALNVLIHIHIYPISD